MQYNFRKLQVLYIINELLEQGKYATLSTISNELKEDDHRVVSRRLTYYFDSKYVSRKRVKGIKGQVYTLTSKGERMLTKYLERFVEGHHLNLRWKGFPVTDFPKTIIPQDEVK